MSDATASPPWSPPGSPTSGAASWPPVTVHRASVEHERLYGASPPRRIEVAQSIPPALADVEAPPPGPGAAEALNRAAAAIEALQGAYEQCPIGGAGKQSVLLRDDADASSKIEYVTAAPGALAAALTGQGPALLTVRSKRAHLVAGNIDANELARRGGHTSTDWFHHVHRILLSSYSDLPGCYVGAPRDCAVWIGPSRERAIFEGPPWRQVPEHLADLAAFCNRTDMAPLLHAAIAHAQFETIHPYADGNGRVGRILIQALLSSSAVPLPISVGMLAGRWAYYDGLNAYRRGDVDEWASTFAAAAEASARYGQHRLESVTAAVASYRSRLPRPDSEESTALLDHLATSPAVTLRCVASALDITKQEADKLIGGFAEAGALRRCNEASARRPTWFCEDLLAGPVMGTPPDHTSAPAAALT